MLKELWTTTFDKLRTLNFYTSASTNLYDVQTGQWATRAYIVLLLCSVIILSFYSSLVYNTETITILQPSVNTFITLQMNAKQNLACPCKEVSIPQSSLVSFSLEFHQFCSSDFLSDDWFSYLAFVYDTQFAGYTNWAYGALPKFKFLQATCSVAMNIVTDAVRTFGEERFITAMALTSTVYNSQMTGIIQSMIYNAAASFSRSVDIILFNKRYEQVLNYYTTSVYLFAYDNVIYLRPQIYNVTCNCGTMFTCAEEILLIVNNTTVSIPGWYIGCYMIDSLLDSTLEAYYDTMYIDLIYASQPTVNWNGEQWNTSTPHPQPLNITHAITSSFPPNTTVRNILNALFVEDWHGEINFENYYQECQPIQCSYTENVRNNLLGVATTILGLVGGLAKAFDFLVPNILRFVRGPLRRFLRHSQRRVNQQYAEVPSVAIISH